jgi:hypothetical protein
MALLGRVDPPGHVVDAPLVSLATNVLLGGLTFLGGNALPCLILLLGLLVGRILLVLCLGIAHLGILALLVAAVLLVLKQEQGQA